MAKSGIKSLAISKTAKSRSPARSATHSAGSSRRDAPEKMNEENITIVPRYSPIKGKTDWAALDALTDKQITEAVRKDPDAVPFDLDWSDGVVVMPMKKTAISIRIDEDVLTFFKSDGEGYQGRMNAVLRSYMNQTKPRRHD
jgi:uncharacterized protein (DUF4415 family)